jgi:hypothetical protein
MSKIVNQYKVIDYSPFIEATIMSVNIQSSVVQREVEYYRSRTCEISMGLVGIALLVVLLGTSVGVLAAKYSLAAASVLQAE